MLPTELQKWRPHLVWESLALPAVTDIVETVLGESYAKEFQKISTCW